MDKKDRIIYESNDKKLRDRLKRVAKKHGHTLKYALETAIKEYIEKRV